MEKVFKFMAILLLTAGCSCLTLHSPRLQYSRALPPLPDTAGFAGLFSGNPTSPICAGGANFPDKAPWNKGKKVYHDRIFSLSRANGKLQWKLEELRLPKPLAYGGSITTPEGLLCMGGTSGKEFSNDVFLLKKQNGKVIIDRDWPKLPVALSNFGCARIGDVVYVVCGKYNKGVTQSIHTLNLKTKKWSQLADFPGEARQSSSLIGANGKLWLFSGKTPGPLYKIRCFTDLWCFDPVTKEWQKKNDIACSEVEGGKSLALSSTALCQLNDEWIAAFGGGGNRRCSLHTRIEIAQEVEKLKAMAEKEADSGRKKIILAKIDTLKERIRQLLIHDPGHRLEILGYHIPTDKWHVIGMIPDKLSTVCGKALKFEDMIIIPSGEIRPGVRTPKTQAYKLIQ